VFPFLRNIKRRLFVILLPRHRTKDASQTGIIKFVSFRFMVMDVAATIYKFMNAMNQMTKTFLKQ